MSKRKTQEQFEKEVYDLVEDEYTVLGKYINSGTNIKLRHNVCGEEWNVQPSNFVNNGYRCRKCSYIKRGAIPQEIMFKQIYDSIGNDYTILGEYNGVNKKIKIRHDSCGYEWEQYPRRIINSKGCPKCFGERFRRTHDEFVQEIFSIVGDEYSVVGKFVGMDKHVLMRHNICGTEYLVKPANFINNNRRCPTCSNSRGENKIREFLILNNIDFKPQYKFDDCRYKYPLPFDFAIFKDNKLDFMIEYDGILHYEPSRYSTGLEKLKETQRNDKIKTNYCVANNILLLRIPYWEFQNIEQILQDALNEHFLFSEISL